MRPSESLEGRRYSALKHIEDAIANISADTSKPATDVAFNIGYVFGLIHAYSDAELINFDEREAAYAHVNEVQSQRGVN